MVFKPKGRMIRFRLSEEQYLALRQISLAQGARSVSDYARDTLFRQLAEPAPPDGLEFRISRLARELHLLNRTVERLRAAVEQPLPIRH